MKCGRVDLRKRSCAVLMTGVIGLGGTALAVTGSTPVQAAPTASAAVTAPAADSTIGAFLDPQQPARTMVRMWFPDADAGDEEGGYLNQVEDQISDLAAGGFGGVEIAYLADYVSSTNDEMATRGWGTENWRRILKTVLSTANSADDDFQVDLTITAHWPPSVNTIDFNDSAASQESSQAYTKITQEALESDAVAVPLPETATEDEKGVPFVFADHYDSAAIARVASIDDQGEPVLELASLEDVSADTGKRAATAEEVESGDYIRQGGKNYAGSAAGVPDPATADALGVDYEDGVIAHWGPEQTDPDGPDKVDAEGNRKRMADWQFEYSTDVSDLASLDGYEPSAGEELAAGDYVLIGNYYRGTGQVQSGGNAQSAMHNHAVATNYFSKAGVQAIFDLWDEHILDADMKRMLKANGGSIFEDSIEGHFDTKPWVKGVTSNVSDETDLDGGKYASALVASAVTFDNTDQITRIQEDYSRTLGALYETKHASLISDWASTFGYDYRAQAYTLAGLDIGAAASALDVPEGDNSSSGDGVRTLYGALNMTEDAGDLLSMEAVTFTASIHSPWQQVEQVLNADASDGVNRTILHGSPFSRTYDTEDFGWPGWNFMGEMGGSMGMGGGFTSMNDRQVWWDEVGDFTGYVNRMQAVLQSGDRKVDVAMLRGSEDGYSFAKGNSLQDLLDHGYSYNLLTEPLWSSETSTVTDVDGQPLLAADGPAYQAVVLNGADTLSLNGVQKLLDFADAGLPIAIVDSDPERVYGTDGGGADDELTAAYAELLTKDTVAEFDSLDDVRAFIEGQGVSAQAQYDAKHLETSHIENAEGEYYYLYNDGMFVLDDAPAGDDTITVFDETGATEVGDELWIGRGANREKVVVTDVEWTENTSTGPGSPAPENCTSTMDTSYCPSVLTLESPLEYDHAGFDLGTIQRGDAVSSFDTVEVDLAGQGTPYLLNLATGDVEPIAEYTQDDDSVTVQLSLGAAESTVVALATDTAGFPAAGDLYALAGSDGEFAYDDGDLVLRTSEAGTHTVELSNGSEVAVEAGSVPDAVDLSSGWDLQIESWGPDAEANVVDPTVSSKTSVSFSEVDLGSWLDTLTLTSEQKSTLGVEDISEVSGRASYEKTFTLVDDWDGSTAGAVLRLDHGYDNITGVTVNGVTFDQVDQLTDTITVPASALKQGENTISVELATSLANRAGWTLEAQDQGLLGIEWRSTTSVPVQESRVKAKAKVAVTPAKRVVKAGHKVKLAVKVTAIGVTPTGNVVAWYRGKKVDVERLVKGKARLVFRAKGHGQQVVRISYAGDQRVASASRTVKLRVMRGGKR